MEAISISFIIVTYNSQDLIVDAIESIYRFSDIPETSFEIILVDNSNYEMNAILTKLINEVFPNKQIKIIHNPQNTGYGAGNNIGINAAKGELICIMNPDVRFLEPLMNDVQNKFSSDKNLGLLGYKQTGGFNYSFYMKPEFRNMVSGFQMKLLNKVESFSAEKHYLSGAFFFIDKVKFQNIGLFDEKIFLYFEEPDVSNRMRKKKYHIHYEKSKKYLHVVGNRVVYSDFGFKNEMKSLHYYLKKYDVNTASFLRKFIKEYSIKLKIAKALSDKARVDKFEKELDVIKSIFL